MEKNTKSKAWYKKWWVWLIVAIVLIVAVSASGDSKEASKPATSSESPSSQSEAATPEKQKWDAAAEYEKIQTGMTKAQVEAAVGQPSKNCSESAIEGLGTTESCSYSGGFGDKGTITVIYSNGAVQSKAKLDF